MKIRTSNDLLILQSRLYSPGYGGPGRWVVLKPRTRKAFLAIGSDVIPEVISLLCEISKGVSKESLLNKFSNVSEEQFEKLENQGLITSKHTEKIHKTLLWHYHLAVFDYPFVDYSVSTWREDDNDLMKTYAKMWAPPDAVDNYEGESVSLPKPLPKYLFDRSDKISEEILATVLNYTFAPIGEIPTQAINCIRRTSPSGGARHPSEGKVVLPKGCGQIPAGVFLYDNKNHNLVFDTQDSIENYNQYSEAQVIFVVRSKIERAMWRYRDIRAFRPVLLDAGHILETLSLLLIRCGYSSRMSPIPYIEHKNFDWLATPDLACLIIDNFDSNCSSLTEKQKFNYSNSSQSADSSEFLTNPAFFLKFSEGELLGISLWPTITERKLSLHNFKALSHCLPSNRGDRITTVKGILDAVPELETKDVDELVRSCALLPKNIATKFYDASKLWVKYGWYLSELAHLETKSALRNCKWQSSVFPAQYLENIEYLFLRKTSRAFNTNPVSIEVLNDLLNQVFQNVELGPKSGYRVFLASLNISGLENDLYEWKGELERLKTGDIELTRDLIRELTIGQFPAGSGAFTIWLLREVDINNSENYELDIIEMGRIGQRICLIATELNLGVFLTPAVKDMDLCTLLNIDNPFSIINYLFTIGYRNDK